MDCHTFMEDETYADLSETNIKLENLSDEESSADTVIDTLDTTEDDQKIFFKEEDGEKFRIDPSTGKDIKFEHVQIRKFDDLEICNKCKAVETHIAEKYRHLQTRRIVWNSKRTFCFIEITRFQCDVGIQKGGPATKVRVIYDCETGGVRLFVDGTNEEFVKELVHRDGLVNYGTLDKFLKENFTTQFIYCTGVTKYDMDKEKVSAKFMFRTVVKDGDVFRSPSCIRWRKSHGKFNAKMQSLIWNGLYMCPLCREMLRGVIQKKERQEAKGFVEPSKYVSLGSMTKDQLVFRCKQLMEKKKEVKARLAELVGASDEGGSPEED